MKRVVPSLFLITLVCSIGMVPIALAQVDWWPMYHHDSMHTGYSMSTAPNAANVAWEFEARGGITSSPAIIDGRAYFGSYDYSVYCVDIETGDEIWSHALDGRVYGGPAVIDGRLYIGGYTPSANMYCLDAATGDEIWNYAMGSFTQSSPMVVEGRVYIGSNDGRLYCLDAGDGSLIWSYSTGGGISSSPAVADNRVYFGSLDYNVYCLDADSGDLIWSFPTLGMVLSSPAIGDGKVYIGSNDARLYCFDAETGDSLWAFLTAGAVGCCPGLAGGRVYISSTDADVYCLDANSGNEIWSYTMGSMTFSSPSIAAGKVFVGSNDNKLYCLDAMMGNLIWEYTTGNTLSRTTPSIADEKVFVGSYDGKVYCFGPEMTIGMIPDDPPVTVPAGRRFSYEGFLINNTDEIQTVDVWLDTYLQPDGPRFGPLTGWIDVQVAAYDTISIHPIRQRVHRLAPLGTYTFTAYCGDIEYFAVIDMASFEVTVTAPDENAGYTDWLSSGWAGDSPVDHMPTAFDLKGNYPNPFNAVTIIRYDLPEAGNVRLEIYNLMGQKVETLVDRYLEAGRYSVTWDASAAASGIYFYRLSTGGKVFTRRMTLLK